jgi:hypothetical protein
MFLLLVSVAQLTELATHPKKDNSIVLVQVQIYRAGGATPPAKASVLGDTGCSCV